LVQAADDVTPAQLADIAKVLGIKAAQQAQ